MSVFSPNTARSKVIWRKLKKPLRVVLYGWLCLTLLMLVLSFTPLPFWGLYQLSRPGAGYSFEPEVIVLMGGSGMPGRSALIRSYYTAEAAKRYPGAGVIIALPDDTSRADNHLLRMQAELEMRGVATSRIRFEPSGTNSRAQAMQVLDMLGRKDVKVLLVTDPEHVYRAVRCFEKLGMAQVGSKACFESDLDVSLAFSAKELGGRSYVPGAGEGQLRYQFWNHLIYQILLLREYSAIGYYKVQGWV